MNASNSDENLTDQCVCVCGSILEFCSPNLSYSLSFFLYISVALSMESSFETLNHCIKMNIRDDNISSIEKKIQYIIRSSDMSRDLFHSFIYFAGVFFLSLLLVFPLALFLVGSSSIHAVMWTHKTFPHCARINVHTPEVLAYMCTLHIVCYHFSNCFLNKFIEIL